MDNRSACASDLSDLNICIKGTRRGRRTASTVASEPHTKADCAAVTAAATGRFAGGGWGRREKEEVCTRRDACDGCMQARASDNGAMVWLVAAQGRLDKAAPRAAQLEFRAQSCLQDATSPLLWQPPPILTG